MDLYPGNGKKPLTSSSIVTRKRSGFGSKDASDRRIQEVEFCNRIGCNGKLKYSKNTLFGFTGKAKFSRPSSKESNVCSSSTTTSKSTSGGVSPQVSRRESSLRLGTDLPQSSKSRCRLDDNSLNQAGFRTKSKGVISSSNDASSQSKSRIVFGLNSASGSSNAMSANSGLTAIKNNNKGIRSSLRNPISEPNASRKRVFKDRNFEGESSSSSSIERKSNKDVKFEDKHVSRASNGVTKYSSRHSDSKSTTTSRSLRSSTFCQTSRAIGQSTRVNPQPPQFHSPVEARVNNRPTVESSFVGEFSRVSDHESISVPHDSQLHSLDGIAEILMSLERIGHGAELTNEQLMSFESNLFLGSYQWYDRHRDMRLDIDNMSYEELLALEERMGNVSTALPEESLSKCIRKSIYRNPSVQLGFSSCCSESEDDVKCSVCQEDYRVGEEIGKLVCEHRYHELCIKQWLGLKNWCPICKKAVVATPSTSQFKQTKLD